MVMKTSKKFLAELKTSKVPAYQHAQAVGMTATDLSKVIHGALPIAERRQRQIDKIAVRLGVRGNEVFEVR